jgi:tetratricopeptide (TPR) repeat protein
MSETRETLLPEKEELDEPALMEMGRQARARGDRAAALAFFEKAVAANKIPTRFQPRLDAATELRVLGRVAEAEQIYGEILAQDAANLWAIMGLGQCARTRGDRAAALAFFERAIAANKTPTQFQPRLDAATELRVLGRVAEAEYLYAEIHAQDAENFWALMGLGHCARAAGNRAAALAFFEKAVAANRTPSQVQPRLEAATELRALGKIAEAEPLYAAVQAQEPGNVAALMGLGHCARAAGDRAAALAFFEKAVAANKTPTQFQPRLEAAIELRVLGRIAEAASIYAAIHTQDPENVPALMGLGQCARQQGDRAAALAFYEKAIAASKTPTQIHPRLEAAGELRALGRIAEAEPLYAAIHAQDPGNIPALMGLGHCARGW